MTFNFSLYYGNNHYECNRNSLNGKADFEFEHEISALGKRDFDQAIGDVFKAIIEKRANCVMVDNTFENVGRPASICIDLNEPVIYEFLTIDPREPFCLVYITKIS